MNSTTTTLAWKSFRYFWRSHLALALGIAVSTAVIVGALVVGDSVRGGDTVATVGNSGGNPESGLYFEIRHQGQPVDPLKWASLK